MSKTREELQRELDANKLKIEQYQHKLDQLQNRITYCRKAEEKARTHRLVTRGAAVESIWPEVREFSEKDFYALIESILSLPQSRAALHSFHPSGGADG